MLGRMRGQVNVEEQVGLQLEEEKKAVAPPGNPEAEKVTA